MEQGLFPHGLSRCIVPNYVSCAHHAISSSTDHNNYFGHSARIGPSRNAMSGPHHFAVCMGSKVTVSQSCCHGRLDVRSQVQLFIKCLLASADYDSFFSVMRKEAQKSLRRKRLERDESKVCDAEGKDEGRSESCEGKAVEIRRHSREDERAYK